MKLYRISAMLWASSPWINKGVPAMKCHKWPEQIMHIDATGAYGFASLRRTSTSKTSNCGKHQLWAVVWYKDSCWPASTQVSTHEGRKTHRIVASPRVDLWRWIAPAKTFPPSTKFRQNFHMFFTFLTRCTLGMKRLELPQKRPEKCSFHRLSSNFHWFPQS